MPQHDLADSAEAVVVGLACGGDSVAFSELVRRRQSWIRNLMRRFSGNDALADDLAQQVFLQAWRNIRQLRQPSRFGAWLKRLAVTVWLQHLRRHDALHDTDQIEESGPTSGSQPGMAMDLERALSMLSEPARLCVVLSYHEGMTHEEVAELSGLPLGTVKSHIRRGTMHLRNLLAAYDDQ